MGKHYNTRKATTKRKRYCVQCGVEVWGTKAKKYCDKCRNSVATRKTFTKTCESCGVEFQTPGKNTRNCSPTCHKGKRKQYVCQQCGVTFTPKASDRTRFCGRRCYYEGLAAQGFATKCIKMAARLVKAAMVTVELEQRRQERERVKAEATKPCRECDSPIPVGVGVPGKRLCEYCRAKRKAIARKRRKHRKRAEMAGVMAEAIDLGKLCERHGNRCAVCSRKVRRTKKYHKRQATIGHIIAVSRGGPHTWGNVQLECQECNGKKGTKTAGQRWLLD